ENEVKACLSQLYQNGEVERFVQVWGKQFPDGLEGIPEMGGLNPSVIMQKLIPLLRTRYLTKLNINDSNLLQEEELINQALSHHVEIPGRTPTFCPGCPHRDSASVFLDVVKQFMDAGYMKKHYDSPPIDLVFHGDIGCYSMLKYEPYPRLMHNLSAMALGGGTGAGIDPFIKNKQVVFMGDSTFFHGGMAAISDSIKNGQDIAYVILDNQTTAMTGHQPTPSTGEDILGNPTFAQDIERVARGLVADSDTLVARVDPENRYEYKSLLETSILKPGVKIFIADKECGITYHRRVRREQQQTVKEHGFVKIEKHINITEEVCEFCLECTKATGCPGLKIVETEYGPKIGIDQSDCVSDGACARIKWACPSFEEVTVTRKRPPRKSVESSLIQLGERNMSTQHLPPPRTPSFDKTWNAYAAGVGGMGIGTISKILVVAGHIQGYHVQFCDKKGLAIRNGGVYTHVVYSKTDNHMSPLIPYGKADLLLGLDILEAVRGIDPKAGFNVASPDLTAAIVNTAKTDTVRSLIGKDGFEVANLEEWLRMYTQTDEYFGVDLFNVAEKHLGSKLYANIMLLGVAFQRAQLPLELGAIQLALKQMVRPSDLESNLRAFEIGRWLALHPDAFVETREKESYEHAVREKCQTLRKQWRGRSIASDYSTLVKTTVNFMQLDDETNRGLAVRIYDLIQLENLRYARLYVEKIKRVHDNDSSDQNYRATKAAIKYLHKVMLIKDEIYVSHLLTSQEKLQRDKERYAIDESNGDKIKYVHLNRPHFRIMGIDLEGELSTRNWQLSLMKRMKFLRRWLSQWHANEKSFRDWYISEVVDTFAPADTESYEKHVNALETPEEVRGYREVRYPKMKIAKDKVEELIGLGN
ncbi:MAG: 2-oxoacid:acceptor oxidoreductase family protein, partial [Candidatus Poribacteria bacterium]|nr:2-oxoacid:acceptor oxidoreductase family protein [Candidatus Poribacteria bacterium]